MSRINIVSRLQVILFLSPVALIFSVFSVTSVDNVFS